MEVKVHAFIKADLGFFILVKYVKGKVKKMLTRYQDDYTWENVETLVYKEDGSPFKEITRQILIEGVPELPCQLRYFEVAPGGYSTLEHHQHVHFVFILRGEGEALVGEEVQPVKTKDVLVIPSFAWHQLRATTEQPLGFLCLVSAERDKPVLPTPDDLTQLRQNPAVAAFIRS